MDNDQPNYKVPSSFAQLLQITRTAEACIECFGDFGDGFGPSPGWDAELSGTTGWSPTKETAES